MTCSLFQLPLCHSSARLLDWICPVLESAHNPSSKESLVSVSVGERLLCYLLELLGGVALGNKNMQELLGQGAQPTVLTRLCKLPMKFFTNDRCGLRRSDSETYCFVLFRKLVSPHRFKDRLYNCLAGLCLRNSNSLEAMRLDLNPLLIGTYFQRKIHASTQLFGLKGEGKVGEMSLRDSLIRNSEIPSGETKIVCCCVPPSLWGDCVEFFR